VITLGFFFFWPMTWSNFIFFDSDDHKYINWLNFVRAR
jgi:hypothetical protein